MNKSLLIFCFLFFMKSYSQSQEEIDFCREFNQKSLKEIYHSDKTFSCYLKEDDFHIEVKTKLNLPNKKYQDPIALNALKEEAKNDVYDKIKVMNDAGLFDNRDELPCEFDTYKFHYIYVTSDHIKITYDYDIIPEVLFKISRNLNKEILFKILAED